MRICRCGHARRLNLAAQRRAFGLPRGLQQGDSDQAAGLVAPASCRLSRGRFALAVVGWKPALAVEVSPPQVTLLRSSSRSLHSGAMTRENSVLQGQQVRLEPLD